jgi:hypothetical protein
MTGRAVAKGEMMGAGSALAAAGRRSATKARRVKR